MILAERAAVAVARTLSRGRDQLFDRRIQSRSLATSGSASAARE